MSTIHISEIVANWATSAGIVLGGGWAIYKWSFSEWLRKRHRIPSLQSSADVEIVRSVGEESLVSIDANWHNTSEIPIEVDIKWTRVVIYEMGDEMPKTGPVYYPTEIGKEMFHIKPLKTWTWFTLEPGTENKISALCSLPKGKEFWAVCKLRRKLSPLHREAIYEHALRVET